MATKEKKGKTVQEEANEWLQWFKTTPTYINMAQVVPEISLAQTFTIGFMAARGQYQKIS